MISILDYGMGNLASIRNMLARVGAPAQIIKTPGEIAVSRALIIPGVGKFDNAVENIETRGLRPSLDEMARVRRIPILGICLGMQLMTRGSEEGQRPGLGWVDADTRRIMPSAPRVRVPHMGWNRVMVRKDSPCFDGVAGEQRFYFVHSYVVHCDHPEDVLTTTPYAGEFVSAFSRGNLVGVQFHPEKSHTFGAGFFRRFTAAYGLPGTAAS